MALPKVLANFTTSLASKITSSATSMTLSRSTDPDGTTLAGQYIVTVDEGTSVEEHMLVTLAGATATIDTRGLSKVDMSTSVSGNKFAHDRGAEVKITNAVLVRVINELNGVTSTSAMVGTTGTAWRIGNGTDQDAFVYAQNADAAKPFVKYDKTLNKWLISNDGTTTYDITSGGSGLSAGSGITISVSAIKTKLNASGLLSASLGAGSDELGLVTDISAALAGTSGTPSAGNKFVTASDVSVSGSASKIVRMNGSGVVAGSVLGLTQTGDIPYFNDNGLTKLSTGGLGTFLGVNSTNSAIGYFSNLSSQYISTDATSYFFTQTTSGTNTNSVVFASGVSAGNTPVIARFSRENSGRFLFTGKVESVGGIGTAANSAAGCVTIGSYVYVSVVNNTGPAYTLLRYDAADLANGTTMTISGGTPATGAAPYAFTDGTFLYLSDSTTQWKKYSISGTTATFVSNVTITTLGPAWCDGTNVYISSSSSALQKWSLSGSLSTTKTHNLRYANSLIAAISGGVLYGDGSSVYISTSGALHSNSALEHYASFLVPIDKP